MSIATRLWFAASVVLVALAMMAALVLWTIASMDRAVSGRLHARESLLQVGLVLSDLREAEAAQRGYLLTGVDIYLTPVQNLLESIPGKLKELKLAANGASQLWDRLAQLEELAREKIEELQQTISLRRDQGFDAAHELVMTHRGKQLMDNASEVVNQIKALQRAEIDRRGVELQEIHDRLIVGLIFGSFAVGVCVLLTNGLIVRSLRRPLDALRKGIARIAAGDFTQDIEAYGKDELNRLARAFNAMMADLRAERASRHQAEEEVARGAVSLRAHSVELEQRTRTIDLLGRMANRLPGSKDEQEFVTVIERFVPQILPRVRGALYVLSNSQTILRRIGEWNNPIGSAAEFTPSECWGIRRGHAHAITDASDDIVCPHVSSEQLTGYRCLPLVAQGETVGLFYVEERHDETAINDQDLHALAETIGLSLVNLRLQEKLRNQSIRDPLTGLFNRRYLEESLELECSRAERSELPIGMVMLDVDHFKRFNDTFGHDAGDIVLKHIGEILKRSVRQGDVACRFGGEEFVVVLPGTGVAEAFEVAERVRQSVQKLEVVYRNQALGRITVSLGVATYPAAGQAPAELIEAADQALYAAKNAGRDRIDLFGANEPVEPQVALPLGCCVSSG
jgi:diguanylate cyclase (GGDEF)-like protein